MMMTTALHGNESRKYDKSAIVSFRKTNEEFGGLSNMAPGFLITVNGHTFLTSEALYQCCRFPKHPDIQKQIMLQKSPMTAKDISKAHIYLSREDWNDERIRIMRWCVYAKLICNWHTFGKLLDSTGSKDIVEDSFKDDFWGAIWNGSQFVGTNALGRLLMQARDMYRKNISHTHLLLPSLDIPDFYLLGKPIESISVDTSEQPQEITFW